MTGECFLAQVGNELALIRPLSSLNSVMSFPSRLSPGQGLNCTAPDRRLPRHAGRRERLKFEKKKEEDEEIYFQRGKR